MREAPQAAKMKTINHDWSDLLKAYFKAFEGLPSSGSVDKLRYQIVVYAVLHNTAVVVI